MGGSDFMCAVPGVLQHDLSVSRDESFENEVFSVAGDKHGAKILHATGSAVMTAVVTKALLARVEYLDSNGAVGREAGEELRLQQEAHGADACGCRRVDRRQVRSAEAVLLGVPERDTSREDGSEDASIEASLSDRDRQGVDLPLAVGLVWAINFSHLRRVAGAGAGAVGAT